MDEQRLLATARPIVDRRASRAGLNADDRDDLLQDVIVKYLGAFPDAAPRNLPAWIERVTERSLIDRHRAASRRPQDAMPEHGDPHVIPTLVAAWREATATSLGAIKQRLVDEALGLLSDCDREIFERKFLRGEPSADVASSLDISVNTVDQRAGRARRRLRESLEQRPDLVAELAKPHPHTY